MASTTHILFADDDPNIQRMVELFLKKFTLKIEFAKTGRTALKMLEYDSFDMLFTDAQMPEIDGLTLIKEIRRRKWSIPIVLISAYGQESLYEKAKESGVNGVISTAAILFLK